MNPAIAIDLGTTNTVIGVQTDETGPKIIYVPQPTEERNRLEEREQIKSAVLFESPKSAVVGVFAANRLDSIRSIKSKMGTRWRATGPFGSGQMMTPAYISSHILKAAFNIIKTKFPAWDQTAIITVPASFNTDQRNDTLQAAELAGFQNVHLLDEPTAAFYFYFEQVIAEDWMERPLSVLVFDFGGGTLDVSIIKVEAHEGIMHIDPIGRSRYNNLGGDDIDLDIAAFMLACWEYATSKELSSLSSQVRKNVFKLFLEKAQAFREEAEDYIANRLELNEFIVTEEVIAGEERLSIQFSRELSRSQYDEITGRFFTDKSEINIYKPIGQALAVAQNIDSNFMKDSLDLVLYTGGASQMAAVRAALECYFAPKACFPISEHEACNTVALGAASCRYDELHHRAEVRMTNRLLEGIYTRSKDGKRYISVVPLTCEPRDDFTAVEDIFRTQRDQIQLTIPLFRGTSPYDSQLSPMRDLELPLDRIVERGTPYSLHYRMSQNKIVELKAVFKTPGGSVEVTGVVDPFSNKRNARDHLHYLCQVNEMKG
jgi:molecular chaperone DnaK